MFNNIIKVLELKYFCIELNIYTEFMSIIYIKYMRIDVCKNILGI